MSLNNFRKICFNLKKDEYDLFEKNEKIYNINRVDLLRILILIMNDDPGYIIEEYYNTLLNLKDVMKND